MKKLASFAVVAALLFALSPAPAAAMAWNELGASQFAMGGAGIADAQGPLAAYWNPAALGRPGTNNYGLAIPVDVQATLKGPVIAGAKDLSNCIKQGASCQQSDLNTALNQLNHPGEGLLVDAGAGGNLKIGKFTVFLNDFVDFGAQPHADLIHNTVATISQNTSSLVIRGANIAELGLGYGHELPVPGVYLGGDVKIIRAEVGYENYSIASNNGFNTSDLTKNFKNNTDTSGNFGVDVGALWDIDKTFDGAFWGPRLGITGRDLNNPKFNYSPYANQYGESRYALNPEWRTGFSFSPTHWWHFAADADLTKNITQLDNAPSQNIGAGTEINVFNRPWINIPIRVGIKHNMANPTNGATFTAGTGINLLHLIIDVSGEVANQKITTASSSGTTTIPRQLGGAVQISFLFGGSEERRYHHGDDSSAAPSADAAPSAAPSGTLDQSATDRVKADADKAQQDLNNQSAPK